MIVQPMFYFMASSLMFDKSASISLIAHDAGSANLLTHFFIGINTQPAKVFMVGPAQKIWENYYPDMLISNSIKEAVSGCSIVITGTGWQTDIEHEARILAKNMDIYSIACLDHWVNYEERFNRYNEIILPDEIWVFDKHALDLARNFFPDINILLEKNYYIHNMLQSAKNYTAPQIPEILYLTEPIKDNWGRGTDGELQALDYFLENIGKLGLPTKYNLVLRLHPSENSNKYLSLLQSKNVKFRLDISTEVAESISRSLWVVGCQTFALVLALQFKKTVYSSLPPHAPKSTLPFKEIINIKDL